VVVVVVPLCPPGHLPPAANIMLVPPTTIIGMAMIPISSKPQASTTAMTAG
jgi:hypothetical protein